MRSAFEIAGLLVAAVAAVAIVHQRADAQRAREARRCVARRVVREDHVVDDLVRDRVERAPQRLLGAIRRHHDRDAPAVQHDAQSRGGMSTS
jgi:hypothetical protein